MADITSKYIYRHTTVNKTQTNSNVICEYNSRYKISTIIKKEVNNSMSLTNKKMISAICTKVVKNELNKRKNKVKNSRKMYGYSKEIKNTKKCKSTNKYTKRYTQKPVMYTTTIKYCNNGDGNVNSNVRCTRRKSTRTVEYTWQSRSNRAERGYTGDVNAKVVCYIKAVPKAVNMQKYSTSDITEMAENNGAMDVDPEGHRVYGPYGKRIFNLMCKIICICKIPKSCGALHSARSKYVWYKYVKMKVRRNECRSTRIPEYVKYILPEAVVTYTWSARRKDVYVQSSSWHKEYGE
jgi:nitrate reductase cytochrome c-type subunit